MNNHISEWILNFFLNSLRITAELLDRRAEMKWESIDKVSLKIPFYGITWEAQRVLDSMGKSEIVLKCSENGSYFVENFTQWNSVNDIHNYITLVQNRIYHPDIYKFIFQYLVSQSRTSMLYLTNEDSSVPFTSFDNKWRFERRMEILGETDNGTQLFIDSFINRSLYTAPDEISRWRIKTLDEKKGWKIYINAHGVVTNPCPIMNIWVVEEKWKNIFLPLIDLTDPLYETITKQGTRLERVPLENIGIWVGSNLVEELEKLEYKFVDGFYLPEQTSGGDEMFYISKLYRPNPLGFYTL